MTEFDRIYLDLLKFFLAMEQIHLTYSQKENKKEACPAKK